MHSTRAAREADGRNDRQEAISAHVFAAFPDTACQLLFKASPRMPSRVIAQMNPVPTFPNVFVYIRGIMNMHFLLVGRRDETCRVFLRRRNHHCMIHPLTFGRESRLAAWARALWGAAALIVSRALKNPSFMLLEVFSSFIQHLLLS